MRLFLIFLFWICSHFSIAQQNTRIVDFLKGYRGAVDPNHSLDTVRSVTFELHWLIRSANPVLSKDQQRIQHISIDPNEDFTLELNAVGWQKEKNWLLDMNPNISGMQRIREYFVRLDTSVSSNLTVKFINDSVTVIQKKMEPDFGSDYTFDSRTKLPIRLDAYSLNNSVQSRFHASYSDYQEFSGIKMCTKLQLEYANASAIVTQTLVDIHFNLTPEQAMALREE